MGEDEVSIALVSRAEIWDRARRSVREIWYLHLGAWGGFAVFAWLARDGYLWLAPVLVGVAIFTWLAALCVNRKAAAWLNSPPLILARWRRAEFVHVSTECDMLTPRGSRSPLWAALALSGWSVALGILFSRMMRATGNLGLGDDPFGFAFAVAAVGPSVALMFLAGPFWVLGALPNWSGIRFRDPVRRVQDRFDAAFIWKYAGPGTAVVLLWQLTEPFRFESATVYFALRAWFVVISFAAMLPTAALATLIYVVVSLPARADALQKYVGSVELPLGDTPLGAQSSPDPFSRLVTWLRSRMLRDRGP